MSHGGGASHLAAIYGSEQDKVNCSFYLKIGACRHGERCSRKHIKPQYSQTLVILNMYANPAHDRSQTSNPHLRPADAPPLEKNPSSGMTEGELREQFDKFYEDVYAELSRYGHLLEMHVCDNVGDHLIGNVYARFDWEDEAQKAVEELNKRWFAGRPLYAELSPVTDFREACCRQNDLGQCDRGGFCNFMHLRHPSRPLLRSLQHSQRAERRTNPEIVAQEAERAKEMEMFGADFMGGGQGGQGTGGPPRDEYGRGGVGREDRGGGGYGGGGYGREREYSPRRGGGRY